MHGTVFGIMKRDEWERSGNLISVDDLYRDDLMDYVSKIEIVLNDVIEFFESRRYVEWIDKNKLIFKINKKEREAYMVNALDYYKQCVNGISNEKFVNDMFAIYEIRDIVSGKYEEQLFEHGYEQPVGEIDWLASKEGEDLECEYAITIVGDYHY